MSDSPHFTDPQHAFYVGWVWATALEHGLPFEVVRDEDGNYTDRLRLQPKEGLTIDIVVPPPPDDWDPFAEDDDS